MADQQHASSWAGDPAHMPDGWAASVNSLTGNKGLLGQNPGNPTARQAIPGSNEVAVREQYPFQSGGVKELLGQNPHEGITDPDLPRVPDPAFAGESGTTNMGPQGSPLDWNSVGTYRYPEYPMSGPQKTGYTGPTSPMSGTK